MVFDGKSGPEEARRAGDLGVLYSRRDQTADSVIEGMVAALKGEARNATVVTADGAERVTVEALGGYCVSPEWLELEMQAAAADFEEMFRQSRRRNGGR